MSQKDYQKLSKRERQIMDIIHQLGEASVAEVLDRLPDPPGYNSARMLMNILERKGMLKHRQEKKRYIYSATTKTEEVKKSALDHLLKTFFGGSAPKVVSTLIQERNLSPEDLDELSQMIEKAKQEQNNDGN